MAGVALRQQRLSAMNFDPLQALAQQRQGLRLQLAKIGFQVLCQKRFVRRMAQLISIHKYGHAYKNDGGLKS